MTDHREEKWRYAGSNEVTKQGKINIPSRLFSEGVLSAGAIAHWSFERGSGYVVLSNNSLEKGRYVEVGHSTIGKEEDSYRTNIPKGFFDDYEGRGRGEHDRPVPGQARIDYKERRFFAYRSAMATGSTTSCYMLDWDEIDNALGDRDSLPGDLPRFLSG
jgi:hypothetical protein